MRVLITGGTGYLGGRIAKYLEYKNNEIILGTRKKISKPEWLKKCTVEEISWANTNSLLRICSGIDAVVHCAGVNALDCEKNPMLALEFNGLATARLVKACELQGVKKFLYLSTAHVYGAPLLGKFTENSLPKNKHPYATSSLAGENAVLKVTNNGNCLDRMVLRLSNAVGPPIHESANCWILIANELCREIVVHKQLTIKSNRKNKRDFFPISLLLLTISSLLGLKEFRYPIMNVCSSISLSLEELANLLSIRAEPILGFKPSIRYNDTIKNCEEQQLHISNARLGNTVTIENSLEKEIDDLLLSCKLWF